MTRSEAYRQLIAHIDGAISCMHSALAPIVGVNATPSIEALLVFARPDERKLYDQLKAARRIACRYHADVSRDVDPLF